MKNKINIEHKVDSALNSINHIERASMPPYFFTRLEARMQGGRSFWEKTTLFLANPIIAFGSICLILFVNIYIITSAPQDGMNMAQQTTDFTSVEEYNQISFNLFEFENFKP